MTWTPTWPANNPLKGVHERLLWIAPLFILAMAAYGSAALVNFGTDGKHSIKTAHARGCAIDINHKDMRFKWAPALLSASWFMAVAQFGMSLIRIVNLLSRTVDSSVEYYLVLEASHFHLEITLAGEAPNIKNWEKGKYFYSTEEVNTIMKGVVANG